MRLIDADKLYPDTFGKGRLAVSQSQIADAPTVQAVPIEVLQEIRQKISNLVKTYPFINHMNAYVKEKEVLEIIDKYRVESEV